MTDAIDLYTQRPGEAVAPPTRLAGRIKHLGPSIIVSGSIVGSGEILLTSSLGAQAGFVLLWWVLVSCWSKSIVQAEITRYVITSGDTYLRALNRLPGRIPGPWGPFSWPIGLGLLAFVPGVLGLSGIIGSAGQALQLLVDIDPIIATATISLGTILVLGTGTYLRIERAMLVFVISFTVLTIVCAVLMQFTEYRMTLDDVKSGFTFEFPTEYFVIALAMYGYTGVNSGETAAYTYWCVEKGYPSYIGPDRDDPEWVARAKGWIKVLHTDVWVTLVLLTLATLPFYFLGAGVLHRLGQNPEGLETIRVLSSMFTETLGAWSLWVFGVGAFFILFSTVLSAIGAGGRFIPEYLIELGIIDRANVRRKLWIRGYVLVIPVLSFVLYMTFQNPVVLVTIGAITAALFLPIQSGATLWLQRHHMDQRVRPSRPMYIALWSVFVFQCVMALAVIRYVVF
ncbi:MAG: Nramp family divalent metal transporter [Gammaproteobacteria bacterium]|nr:Nramp family divalent metal transporter [Gammaproteobacteria bacterium]